jgi:hypothetical protein
MAGGRQGRFSSRSVWGWARFSATHRICAKKDDVCADRTFDDLGKTSFAEVVLGGSVAIPAAATFFGITATQVIASQGTFYLGFASMPPCVRVLSR